MIYDLDCVHLNFSDLRNLFLGANQISEIPSEIKVELVSKELNHFGVIADLFRQIGGHSSIFVLFCSF